MNVRNCATQSARRDEAATHLATNVAPHRLSIDGRDHRTPPPPPPQKGHAIQEVQALDFSCTRVPEQLACSSSDHFDEPLAIAAIAEADRGITIHGATGAEPTVYAGGLDLALRSRVLCALSEAGFMAADDPSPTRQGKGATNICNRGCAGKGLQLELTLALRKGIFLQPDERGLRRPSPLFHEFVSALRSALCVYASRRTLVRSTV